VIFAREITDPLTSLVKKLDQTTADNSSCRMGSFITFLNDDEGLEKQLKDLADKEKLKHIVLTIEANKAGPRSWKIDKDADITVILYSKRKVAANYAFKKGEFKEGDVEKIVADVKKITPEK
jgi:hypothetical protein